MLPMKPDLQELIISNGEFRKRIGDDDDIDCFVVVYVVLYLLCLGQSTQLLYKKFVLGNTLTNDQISLLAFAVLLSVPLIIMLFQKRRFRTTFDLKKQVTNHNQIINNLHTLDQLAEIGNPVKINDRDAVIEALKITREGLVRALKTERILRENPKFKPEYFYIDLSTLEAEKITIKAIEYAQLLDDAVQIGVSVQKEMRKLQSKR
ncbi:MAG: hypothetical protein ACKO3K_00610 [Cuspidothrix sp.]